MEKFSSESKREREWVAGVGFLAENRTYVIFSFLPVSLFGERWHAGSSGGRGEVSGFDPLPHCPRLCITAPCLMALQVFSVHTLRLD